MKKYFDEKIEQSIRDRKELHLKFATHAKTYQPFLNWRKKHSPTGRSAKR